MSKIKIHHLNKKRKKIGIKELDLTKYSKFGSTGNGLYFQPKRGKGFMVYYESEYDIYDKHQKYNDKAAGRYFTYALIDKNLPDKPNNRKRDEKGRPIRIYEEKKDLYEECKVGKWWFIDNENWDKLLEYVKESGASHLFYDQTLEIWHD